MAKAVVDAAKETSGSRGAAQQVRVYSGHGISTTLEDKMGDKKAIIGSAHFVFEDESCTIPAGKQELFDSLPPEYSPPVPGYRWQTGRSHLHSGSTA